MDAPILNLLLSDFSAERRGLVGCNNRNAEDDDGDGRARCYTSGPQIVVQNSVKINNASTVKEKYAFNDDKLCNGDTTTTPSAESTLPLSSEEELFLDLACSGVASTLARGGGGGGENADDDLDDFFLEDLFLELEVEQTRRSADGQDGGIASRGLNEGPIAAEMCSTGSEQELGKNVDDGDEDDDDDDDDDDDLFVDCDEEVLKSSFPLSSPTANKTPEGQELCYTPATSTSALSATGHNELQLPPVDDGNIDTSCSSAGSSPALCPAAGVTATVGTAAANVACLCPASKAPTGIATCGGSDAGSLPPITDLSTIDCDTDSISRAFADASPGSWYSAECSGTEDDDNAPLSAAALVDATAMTVPAEKLAEIHALSKKVSEVVSSIVVQPVADNVSVQNTVVGENNTIESDNTALGVCGPSSSPLLAVEEMPPSPSPRQGVPVKILNEAKLFQSAKISENRPKTDGSSGGVAKVSSSSTKKKRNEFGKRRRSSGGGGTGPPDLNELGCSPGESVAQAGEGGGVRRRADVPGWDARRKGKKKIDPLKAVKDARYMSKKPLILQWLKSDGCELEDKDAEGVLKKSVGSLSAIHKHYWSSGG